MIEANEFPTLKDSIYINDIFKNRSANGKVIIGDLENDTFFLIPEKQENAFNKIDVEFSEGDAISHTEYGVGVVISVDKSIITVAFPHPYGIKKLMKNHKSITKV